LGRYIIHTVTNPLARLTGAIHVYGGDFYAVARQRVGSGAAVGAALRYGEECPDVRGSKREADIGIKLFALTCGHLTGDLGYLMEGGEGRADLPIPLSD